MQAVSSSEALMKRRPSGSSAGGTSACTTKLARWAGDCSESQCSAASRAASNNLMVVEQVTRWYALQAAVGC